MLAIHRRQRGRPYAIACAVFVGILFACTGHSLAVEAKAKPESREFIITDVPKAGSSEYQALREAGIPLQIEALEMSKAEVWTVPAANWDGFLSKAKTLGVTILLPDGSSPHFLAPMAPAATMSPGQQTMMHDAMASKTAMGIAIMQPATPALDEYALTRGMHQEGYGAAEISIALSDTLSVKGRRQSVSKAGDAYAWHGVVAETGEPITLLWRPGGKIAGTVTYRRRAYTIRNLGNGMLGIVKTDPQAFPDEHAKMSAEQRTKMNMRRDPLVTEGAASTLMQEGPAAPQPPPPSELQKLQDAAPDPVKPDSMMSTPLEITPPPRQALAPAVTIRVVVAYTSGAAKHYADIESDLIPLAIEEANQSFRNSGVGNVQLELAYAYRTAYVEDGTHFDHVFRFAKDRDGYMDEIHEIRNRVAADVAVLIVDDSNGCGLAAQVFARPDRAFAVVNHECAATMYSLGHEIGHLIGTRHDAALDNSVVPFEYGHGFVAGSAWRSMMGYKDACNGCIRLPLWSNPRAQVNGVPAGNSFSDNARVIAEQAARVAGFR